MERSVEHGNLRHVRHLAHASQNAFQIRRIVQGRKLAELVDLRDDSVIDKRRRGELLSAMHDSMPDCGDLVHACDRAAFRVGQ